MSGTSTIVGPESAEWRELLARVPHGVYHHPGYVQLDADVVGGTALAWMYREGERETLVPLVRRPVPGSDWTDVSSPYGYGAPASNVTMDADGYFARCCRRLVLDLRDAGVLTAFLRSDPMADLPPGAFDPAGCAVQHGATVAIDLTPTEDELVAGFRRDHRRDVRKARAAGVETVFDDWGLLPTFAAIYRDTMARVSAEGYYFFDDAYFDRLRDALEPELHLVVALLDGAPVAASLLFEHDGLVQYHLSGTSSEALTVRPSKLLVADIATWAKRRGNRAFHLGGGVGGLDDTLFQYKAGFSSWHRPFSTLRVVTDEAAYAEVVERVDPGADSGDRGAFFPAYRRGLGAAS